MEPSVILPAATNRESFAANVPFTMEQLEGEAWKMYIRLASSTKYIYHHSNHTAN